MSTKLRIMHVITGLGVGGAEHMLLRLVTGSRSDRFVHDVVTLDRNGTLAPRFRTAGVEIHELGLSFVRPGVLALAQLVRRMNPAVIQGWMYHGNVAALVGSRLARHRAPIAWNVRQTLYDLRREKRLTKAVIRLGAALSVRPATIVYNSSTSARQHETLGYDAARTRLIPNGFDCAAFSPDAEARLRMRTALRINRSAVVVAVIARFHPMKDHPAFVAAAAVVARQHPDAHFLLVGRGVRDVQSGIVQALDRAGLSHRTTVLGERHDMSDIYNAVDIGCSSSAWGEGFSNAIGEAMACGVPCVVTDVGDSAAIVGETGAVVAPRDSASLARAIGGLIASGAERRHVLGAAARQRIEEQFSLPAIIEQYEALYETLALKGNGMRPHISPIAISDR